MEQAQDTEESRLADVDQSDRDIQLKRAIDVLSEENRELRRLVVSLSETILKRVVTPPTMFSPDTRQH